MNEFTEWENRRITYGRLIQVRLEVSCEANPSIQRKIETDGARIVKTGSTTTLQGIIKVLQFQKVVLIEIGTASVDISVKIASRWR